MIKATSSSLRFEKYLGVYIVKVTDVIAEGVPLTDKVQGTSLESFAVAEANFIKKWKESYPEHSLDSVK